MLQYSHCVYSFQESAQINVTRDWARWMSRAFHKKSTIELLLKGRTTSGSQNAYRASVGAGDAGNLPHQFVKHNFTAPEHCHVCNRILWGVVKQGNFYSTFELDRFQFQLMFRFALHGVRVQLSREVRPGGAEQLLQSFTSIWNGSDSGRRIHSRNIIHGPQFHKSLSRYSFLMNE